MADQAVAKDQDQDVPKPQGPDAKPAEQVGAGVQALQALISKGPPDPNAVVKLIDAHRNEHDAMFALLHQTLGNAYVAQVTQAMASLRASLDRKEVVAGDPNNPNNGFFEASAADQGAKWSTKGGGFTGTADKTGLDTHTKLDAHDELHATVDKDKSATVDWNKDGKTELEASGKYGGKDDWNAGVKKDWDLGDKSTLDTKLSHTVTKDGATDALSADYKSGDGKTTADGSVGVSGGKLVGDANATQKLGANDQVSGNVAHDAQKTELGLSETHQFGSGKLVAGVQHTDDKSGTTDKLSADYKSTDGKTSVSGAVTDKDGKLSETVSGSQQLGANDTLSGTLAHDPTTTSGSLSETHKFGNGGTLTSNLEASQGDKGFAGKWSEAYKDKSTSVDASVAKNADGTTAHAGATEQVNPNLSLAGSLDRTDPTAAGKQSETSFDLTEKYKSDKVVQSFSLGGGTGERDYLNMKGGVDAQLAPKLYGGAWGGASVEAGKQTQAQLGASLTFTPNEKQALTLAGVIDQHGSIETRLQYDVFKSKVNSVSDLSDHKKDAVVSLFLSYKQSLGGPSQLDDRYGSPSYAMPLAEPDRGSQVMAGLKISF